MPKTPEPKIEKPTTPTANDFVKRYRELVEETGFRIAIKPAWVQRDDGTFSLVVQTSVENVR